MAEGKDPSVERTHKKSAGKSFRAVAEEWIEARRAGWSLRHMETVQQRLASYLYADLGEKNITEITALGVLSCLRVIERRGALEAARRTLGICSLIFRYAVAAALLESDPCRDLRGALSTRKPGHFAAITDPKTAGQLMRAIDSYQGAAIVRCALHFIAYTFVRPGNIRDAEWKEISFERSEWLIPAEKMKMGREHIVPLSRQAMAVLRSVEEITGEREGYIFPSVRRRTDRRLSDATLTVALRSMGFSKEQMTAHGFRAMASSLLNENGWRPDVIERQLAHCEKNKIRAAYNRTEYITERRQMMQAWSDYLDSVAMHH